MSNKYTVKGAEALFAASFTYAFTGVLVREVSPMWSDKGQVAARWMLVFAFLLAYKWFKSTKLKVPRDKLKYAVILGASFILNVMFFTSAIQKTTLANTLFVFYGTSMILSFLVGTFYLKESVSGPKLIALAFALAGLSLYSHALLGGSLGLLYSVIAAVFATICNVQQKILAGVDRGSVILIQYAVGGILAVIFCLFSSENIVRVVSLRGTLLTILFAIVLIAASNLLLYGYQHFDVNMGTIIMSTELVFGALLGWILFQEVPQTHELMGGALIFAGSLIGSVDIDRLLSRKAAKSAG